MSNMALLVSAVVKSFQLVKSPSLTGTQSPCLAATDMTMVMVMTMVMMVMVMTMAMMVIVMVMFMMKTIVATDRHSKSLFGRDRHDAPFWQGSVKHKSHLERMEGCISPEK